MNAIFDNACGTPIVSLNISHVNFSVTPQVIIRINVSFITIWILSSQNPVVVWFSFFIIISRGVVANNLSCIVASLLLFFLDRFSSRALHIASSVPRFRSKKSTKLEAYLSQIPDCFSLLFAISQIHTLLEMEREYMFLKFVFFLKKIPL